MDRIAHGPRGHRTAHRAAAGKRPCRAGAAPAPRPLDARYAAFHQGAARARAFIADLVLPALQQATTAIEPTMAGRIGEVLLRLVPDGMDAAPITVDAVVDRVLGAYVATVRMVRAAGHA
jgi:hypothetical protein